MAFDLLLRGGVMVGPEGVRQADIGIRDGRIAEVGSLASGTAREILRVSGLHVLPGLIDSHVHFRTPGGAESETFESGSRAALLGGVCTVFDMPNTQPPLVDAAALAERLRLAKGCMHVDYAFWLGATRSNGNWLRRAERQDGVAGVKLFMGSSTGDLLVDDDAGVEEVLAAGRRRVAVHAEDEARLRQRAGMRLAGKPESHSVWRDAEAARKAVERLLSLARRHRRPVHVLHVSAKDELPLLAAGRDLATAEATPHHLTLAAESAYPRLGARAQVNPPIRGRAHRAALWAALGRGLFDTLGSDHAPHGLDRKSAEYPRTPSGFPGVATLLPVMLTHVAAGRLSLQRMTELLTWGPARVFGVQGKGRIAEGNQADLTVVDVRARRRIEDGTWASRVGWTLYAGLVAWGWPVMTVLRGRVVLREGEVLGAAAGAPVRFCRPRGW